MKSRSVEEMAQALTARDVNILKNINMREFYKFNKKSKESCPTVFAAVDEFNNLTNYVITDILSASKPSDAMHSTEYWIEVAYHMAKEANYKDFHSAQAILAAVNKSQIHRLRDNLEKPKNNQEAVQAISDDARQKLAELDRIFLTKDNYKNQREEFLEASKSRPAIPYMGLYQTDATFALEGNISVVGAQKVEQIIESLRKEIYNIRLMNVPNEEKLVLVNEITSVGSVFDEDKAYARSKELLDPKWENIKIKHYEQKHKTSKDNGEFEIAEKSIAAHFDQLHKQFMTEFNTWDKRSASTVLAELNKEIQFLRNKYPHVFQNEELMKKVAEVNQKGQCLDLFIKAEIASKCCKDEFKNFNENKQKLEEASSEDKKRNENSDGSIEKLQMALDNSIEKLQMALKEYNKISGKVSELINDQPKNIRISTDVAVQFVAIQVALKEDEVNNIKKQFEPYVENVETHKKWSAQPSSESRKEDGLKMGSRRPTTEKPSPAAEAIKASESQERRGSMLAQNEPASDPVSDTRPARIASGAPNKPLPPLPSGSKPSFSAPVNKPDSNQPLVDKSSTANILLKTGKNVFAPLAKAASVAAPVGGVDAHLPKRGIMVTERSDAAKQHRIAQEAVEALRKRSQGGGMSEHEKIEKDTNSNEVPPVGGSSPGLKK